MICYRVAEAQGGDMFAWAARPFHLTAYAYLMLLTREYAAATLRNAEGLRAANRTAIAYHEPERLQAEHADLQRRAGLLPSVDEAKAKGATLMEKITKLGWIPNQPPEVTS